MATENNLLKSQLKIYFRNIKKQLVCDRKTKNKMLADFENNVYDYIDNNPYTPFDKIVEHFGTPDSIAKEFAAEIGVDYIKKLKTKRVLKITIILFLAALTISVIGIAAVIITNGRRHAVYYYEESVSDYGIIQE